MHRARRVVASRHRCPSACDRRLARRRVDPSRPARHRILVRHGIRPRPLRRHRRPDLAQADAGAVPGLPPRQAAAQAAASSRVARDDLSDDAVPRAGCRSASTRSRSPSGPSDEEFERFAALLHYLRDGPVAARATTARLARLAAPSAHAGHASCMYLATSPRPVPDVCEQLGAAGLNGPNVRVVLEKPLGHDLASAQEINRVVRSVFSETQAFRIDHYLGKPSVQNLMALRFGNALFEPLWRRECIANIQITLAERLGVGTRGDFYDRTGALRDMIQNHALQLLTMVAMEPPSRNDADAIRDEKLKVLRSLKPFTAESVGARRRARPVPRAAPSTASRCRATSRSPGAAGQPHRDLRRAAHRGAELALGRRAVLPAHRQAPGRARRADRRQLPAARRTASSRAANPPNKLVIKLQPRGRPRAAPARRQGRRRRPRRCAGAPRPRLRQGASPRTASAPTSACCST